MNPHKKVVGTAKLGTKHASKKAPPPPTLPAPTLLRNQLPREQDEKQRKRAWNGVLLGRCKSGNLLENGNVQPLHLHDPVVGGRLASEGVVIMGHH